VNTLEYQVPHHGYGRCSIFVKPTLVLKIRAHTVLPIRAAAKLLS